MTTEIIKAHELEATETGGRHKLARVQWEWQGVAKSCILDRAWLTISGTRVNVLNENGHGGILDADWDVTILEPAPEPEPEAPSMEEPMARGAIVEDPAGYWWARGRNGLWMRVDGMAPQASWATLMGAYAGFKVISHGPGAMPEPSDMAFEIPACIEEWPEHDEHLKGCTWTDSVGHKWFYAGKRGRWASPEESGRLAGYPVPLRGPWIRAPRAWGTLAQAPREAGLTIVSAYGNTYTSLSDADARLDGRTRFLNVKYGWAVSDESHTGRSEGPFTEVLDQLEEAEDSE